MSTNPAPSKNNAPISGSPSAARGPKKPPVTTAMLNKSIADMHSRLVTIEHQLDENRKVLAEARAVAKKNPGVASQITRLHAELSGLRALYESIKATVDGINADDKNPLRAQFNQQKLQDAFDKLDLFDDFQTNLLDVSSRLGNVERRVTTVEGEQTMLRQDIHEHHERITFLENIQSRVPWMKLVVGLIAGVVAWFLWLNFFNLTQPVIRADGSIVGTATYDPARTFGAVLIGVSVAMAVFGLAVALTKGKAPVVNNEIEEHPVPIDTHPAHPQTTTPIEDEVSETAPTQVITTTGANSGTH